MCIKPKFNFLFIYPDGKLIHMPRVRFSDIKDKVVSDDGVPFAIVSRYSLRCMYGKDKNQAAKRKNEEVAEKAMEVRLY